MVVQAQPGHRHRITLIIDQNQFTAESAAQRLAATLNPERVDALLADAQASGTPIEGLAGCWPDDQGRARAGVGGGAGATLATTSLTRAGQAAATLVTTTARRRCLPLVGR